MNGIIVHGTRTAVRGLESVTPLLDLFVRLWVANVFFKSGLLKLQSWDSTLTLFQYEFAVPLLPPELAAYLATFIELLFPALLAIGLASRFSAFVLFVFNIIAVISYPGISQAGINDHIFWGFLLAVTLFHGPGKLSLDHLISRRYLGRQT